MATLLSGASVYTSNGFENTDIIIENGSIVSVGKVFGSFEGEVIDCSNKYIFPGFVDVHVHFREPGFSYKETIKSGSMAAARGGYTTVCTMPNLNPCPDSIENLNLQLDLIKKDAVINVQPFGTITKGQKGEELADMDEISADVIGFSDDGRGVQNDEMMLSAMLKAKKLNKIISAHCEVNDLLFGGYIHDGEYAKANGHKGICSESEWKQIERDVQLCKKTGVKYHVCHISAKESVDIIRNAKAEGVDITCETGPHYLTMNDSMLKDEGRFKMNPPIRSEADRLALIEGILDGTVDMIATDHAPHSAEEKSKGLAGSNMGITGLETSFPIMYTKLVKTKVISLEKLIELMSTAPAKRFGIEAGIISGQKADLCIFDLDTEYTIDSSDFVSMGKATPFEGEKVYGKCIMTVCNGKIVYRG